MNDRDKLVELKKLKGEHDQTMRTRMIEIMFRDIADRDKKTVTEAALDFFIQKLERG